MGDLAKKDRELQTRVIAGGESRAWGKGGRAEPRVSTVRPIGVKDGELLEVKKRRGGAKRDGIFQETKGEKTNRRCRGIPERKRRHCDSV